MQDGPAPHRAAVALLAAALLTSPAGLAAQEGTGTLTGRVLDAVRGAPLGFAEVSIPSLERRTLADGDGRFRLEGLPAGRHDLAVSFLGFRTTVREVEVVGGETVDVEVRVAPRPVSVADLDVRALSLSWFPGFLTRREERTGHFFTRKEIAETDPPYLTRLLAGAEGVRIGLNRQAHGHSKRYPLFHNRGPGRRQLCYPAIFVDGKALGPGRPYWHLNEVPPEEVLAMEVYYRGQDVPERIRYAEYRPTGDRAPEVLGGLDRPGAARDRGRPGAEGEVLRILAGAGLLEGLSQRVPRYDEELQRSVYAGLYPKIPRIEHCGAIFVWTTFYPYEDD